MSPAADPETALTAWGLVLADHHPGSWRLSAADLAKALDARWLTKVPLGLGVPFKTYISTWR